MPAEIIIGSDRSQHMPMGEIIGQLAQPIVGMPATQQAAQAAADRAADDAFWAVCLADGDLVGNLFLAPSGPPQWRTWELGYVFHPDRWGQGLATEACCGLLDHVFTDLAAHRVLARCNPENTRSWALLERVGFRREGHQRAAASFATDVDGQPVWHDAFLYAVLDTEWGSGCSRGAGRVREGQLAAP